MSKRKLNKRTKRVIRRSIAGVLLATAIIIAAIPERGAQSQAEAVTDIIQDVETLVYPDSENYATEYAAYEDAIEVNKDINLTGYTKDAQSGTQTEIPTSYAYTIRQMSDGNWEVGWQFEYYMTNIKDQVAKYGVIHKYNSNYQQDTVDLNVNIFAGYKVVEFEDYNDYWEDVDKTTEYSVSIENAGTYAEYFLKKYFATEYDQWLTKLHKYAEDKAAYDALPDKTDVIEPVEPGALTKTVGDLVNKQNAEFMYTYYCENALGYSSQAMSGIDYTLISAIDKRPVSASTSSDTNGYVYIVKCSETKNTTLKTDVNGFVYTDTATIIAIGDGAFKGTENVYFLNLPNEIKYIGDEAFMNSFLQEITLDNVEQIGHRAFKGSSQLRSVVLKNGTSIIGVEAFYGCGIQEIQFPYSIKNIGFGAFANNTKLKKIDFSLITKENSIIGDYAFYDDTALNSLDFYDDSSSSYCTITKIGDAAFAVENGVEGSLTEINLPSGIRNTENFGDYLFAGRTNLRKVIMPSNFGRSVSAEIPENVFRNCANLECVEFPDDGNGSCSYATFKPNTFRDVSFTAFCIRGPEKNGAGGTASPRVASRTANTSYTMTTPFYVPYVYTKGNVDYYEVSDGTYILTANANNELENCQLIDNVESYNGSNGIELVVPSQVGTYVINTVASDCFSSTALKNRTTSIKVEDYSISKIADEVFKDFKNLKEVTVGNSVTEIGNSAFEGCSNLTDVYFNTPMNKDYTGFKIGTDAFKTNSASLIFHGDIMQGYAPFDWATDPDNKINDMTGRRVCYKSNAPYSLTVIRDNQNDGDGLITLVDYPHYENIDADNAKYISEMQKYYNEYYTMDPENDDWFGDGEHHRYSILDKYENIYVYDNMPTQDYEMLSDYELALVLSTKNIVVPKGIESIDAKAYFQNRNNAANLMYVTGRFGSSNLVNLYSDNDYIITPADGGNSITVHCGLFSGNFVEGLTDNGVKETKTIGNDRLESITLYDVKYIPDYCFESCEALNSITLGDQCDEIGRGAFSGCDALIGISENSYFTCDNGILYSKKNDDTYELVQCLAARGSLIGDKIINTTNDPLLKVTSSIAECAFENNEVITQVSLTDTDLNKIPANCFYSCDRLGRVYLPKTVNLIMSNAFNELPTTLEVEIPGTEVSIMDDAFADGQGLIRTYKNSAADVYARLHHIDTEYIGEQHKVIFYDYDGTQIGEPQFVEDGKDAEPPADPVREGYTFKGWNVSYKAITADTILIAQYTEDKKQEPGKEDPNGGNNQGNNNPSGNNPSGNNPSGGNNNTPGGNNTGTSDTTKYKLTVVNGSGSGEYTPGQVVTVTASYPAQGKVFDKWVATITPVATASASPNPSAGPSPKPSSSPSPAPSTSPSPSTDTSGSVATNSPVIFLDQNAALTTFLMPNKDVTVTATFKNGKLSGDGDVTPAASPKPSEQSQSGQNGTGKVDIDSDDISNRNKAYAEANNSTDNFVLKVTQNILTKAVAEYALREAYGSLDDLQYAVFDISLYDATGKYQITDYDGMSIAVTLPIPDDLIKYAGNNKVAAVIDDKLVKLDTKYATIGGVTCLKFDATHFSPYIVYVDTKNIDAGVISDATPKTGDGIHPKWFLSIGLVALSVFLFLKKDKIVHEGNKLQNA